MQLVVWVRGLERAGGGGEVAAAAGKWCRAQPG